MTLRKFSNEPEFAPPIEGEWEIERKRKRERMREMKNVRASTSPEEFGMARKHSH